MGIDVEGGPAVVPQEPDYGASGRQRAENITEKVQIH